MLCNQIIQRNIGKLGEGFCLLLFPTVIDGYTCNSSEFSYSKAQIAFCKGTCDSKCSKDRHLQAFSSLLKKVTYLITTFPKKLMSFYSFTFSPCTNAVLNVPLFLCVHEPRNEET